MAWKRNVRHLIVFLLLGAIANVAVAWGIAFQFTGNGQVTDCMLEAKSERPSRFAGVGICIEEANLGTYVFVAVQADYRGEWRTVENLADSVPPWVERHWHEAELPHADRTMDVHVVIHAVGWPVLSISASYVVARESFLTGKVARHDGAFVLSPPGPHPHVTRTRIIPIRPICPGFAINTIFYATMLWMIFAFPFVLRRHLRRRRGLCPACAYPIGASPVCTECGGDVSRRKKDVVPEV